MEFLDFILRDQAVNTFLGTLVALCLIRFAESLEKNVFRPFIRKNIRITGGDTKLGNVLSNFMELLVVVVLVYLVYRFIIKRMLRKNQTNQVKEPVSIYTEGKDQSQRIA